MDKVQTAINNLIEKIKKIFNDAKDAITNFFSKNDVEKKLFNGWQVYKSYTNEYAISKVRPYYAESLEKAKYRYARSYM